jgi:ubiquinone/menaquinone biosynthesis C-methylase UbiE
MTTMEIEEYARVAKAEGDHWWYRGTRELMRELLTPYGLTGKKVLDAGCGPGGNSAWLQAENEVVGVDTSAEALRLAQANHPRLKAVQGDISDLPFESGSFDMVLVITVLAMVEDDQRALSEVWRVLRPGGPAFLIEPANPWLRREHDAVTRIRRRYTARGLAGLAGEAGLLVRRSTYAYSFLLPPALVLAGWGRIKPRRSPDLSDLQRTGPTRLFERLTAAERKFLTRRDLPFGLSALVLAERPS